MVINDMITVTHSLGTVQAYIFDATKRLFGSIGARTEAQKLGRIYSLHYANNRLYGGCQAHIAIWELNIPASVFRYLGERSINAKLGYVLAMDSINDTLVLAQNTAIERRKMGDKYDTLDKPYMEHEEITAMRVTQDAQKNAIVLVGTKNGYIKIYQLPNMERRGTIIAHKGVLLLSRLLSLTKIGGEVLNL